MQFADTLTLILYDLPTKNYLDMRRLNRPAFSGFASLSA